MSEQCDDETDHPPELCSVETSDYTCVNIDTNLFGAELFDSDFKEGTKFGIEIHQDGPYLAVSAGTISTAETEDRKLYTHHTVSPDQARALADSLEIAADRAEAAEEAAKERHSQKSFLQKLLGDA